jgi:hypothetical protein
LIAKLLSLISRYREEYREWAQAATYRRGMALAGPHVLTYPRYRDIYDRLAARWNVGSGLWDPSHDKDTPPDAFVVEENAFRQEVGIAAIHRILKAHGITRVFELDELGIGHAFDVERVLNPDHNFDCYWTSDSVDWLVHSSHEDTVAFAGAWLVRRVRQIWPSWSEHLRT